MVRRIEKKIERERDRKRETDIEKERYIYEKIGSQTERQTYKHRIKDVK